MRVDFQQVATQTVNVERFQPNVGNPQIAEAIQHAQKIAENKESQKKTETIPEANRSEAIDPVRDEERKRKAMMSRKGKSDEQKEEKEEDNKEKEETLKDKNRRIDTRV